mmetsp:Transcript_22824/g.52850  ORF Transcript_22824/g.52850 Transcript_22824/m.52850 type:complete len:570 (-) Transcript_22824:77-1786(-)
MESSDLPKIVDEVLAKHSQAVLDRLDTWLESLDQRLQQVPRKSSDLTSFSLSRLPEEIEDEEQLMSSPAESSIGIGSPKEVGGANKRKLTRMDSVGLVAEAREKASQVEEAFHLEKQKEQEEAEEEPEEIHGCYNHCRHVASVILASQTSHIFFGLVVVSNSVYLGVQLEIQAVRRDYASDPSFMVAHVIYAVLFTVEVCLHLVADGIRGFLCSEDWAWNWLDVFVVTSSWVELIVDLSNPGDTTSRANSNLRLMRLLRVGRLFRVVRIIRVVKFFRSLRTLVHSLVGTLKSLFWAFILLFLIIYIFGILFTDAVLDFVIESQNSDLPLPTNGVGEDVAYYFGTLYSSTNTLFRTVTNGVTWKNPAELLAQVPLGDLWVQLYHFYVAFCTFAVLNVLTGVFCNSAIKAAESDHEMVVQSLVQTRQELKDQVASLFYQIDERGQGQLTFTDFEKLFQDEAVKAFFESLQIGAVDAWTLFMTLDVDGDHTISVDEFTERCLQLHGPARSADLYALRQTSAKISKQLNAIELAQQHQLDYQQLRAGTPLITASMSVGDAPMSQDDHGLHFRV